MGSLAAARRGEGRGGGACGWSRVGYQPPPAAHASSPPYAPFPRAYITQEHIHHPAGWLWAAAATRRQHDGGSKAAGASGRQCAGRQRRSGCMLRQERNCEYLGGREHGEAWLWRAAGMGGCYVVHKAQHISAATGPSRCVPGVCVCYSPAALRSPPAACPCCATCPVHTAPTVLLQWHHVAGGVALFLTARQFLVPGFCNTSSGTESAECPPCLMVSFSANSSQDECCNRPAMHAMHGRQQKDRCKGGMTGYAV